MAQSAHPAIPYGVAGVRERTAATWYIWCGVLGVILHRVRPVLGYFLAHEHRPRHFLDSGAHGHPARRHFGRDYQRRI